MYRTRFVQFSLTILLAASIGAATSVQAQDSTGRRDQSTDLVFQDARLTTDGVTAVDTAGQTWEYDFDQAIFVKSATPRPGRGGRENVQTPVEVRCTEELRVKPFENSVIVGEDEFVEGTIRASGKVTVRGWVKGGIVTDGSVVVNESGQVDGDISAPEILVRRGGIVLGRQVITGKFKLPESFKTSFETAGLWVVFGFTLFFLLTAFLYVMLMPRQLEHFSHCIVRYPVKSAAVGLLFILGMPVVVLLLVITLVGILVTPFVPLAYVFAITLGVVTFSRLIGVRIARQFMSGTKMPLFEVVLGLAAFMAMWTVVALLLGSSSDVAKGFGIFALVVSIIISCFPICSGVGAAVLSRFGLRPHISLRDRLAAEQAAVPAPAPPPIRRTTPFDVPPPPGDQSAPDTTR